MTKYYYDSIFRNLGGNRKGNCTILITADSFIFFGVAGLGVKMQECHIAYILHTAGQFFSLTCTVFIFLYVISVIISPHKYSDTSANE